MSDLEYVIDYRKQMALGFPGQNLALLTLFWDNRFWQGKPLTNAKTL